MDSFAAKCLWTIGRLVISGRSTTVRMPSNVPPTSPAPAQPLPSMEMPTTSETVQELKRRLGKEIYRMEMDLQGGGRIAGKSCDCLSRKHHLGIEATAEELMSMERNPVYGQVIQWLNRHAPEFDPAEIAKRPPEYYQGLAPELREFRKEVLGSGALGVLLNPEERGRAQAGFNREMSG